MVDPDNPSIGVAGDGVIDADEFRKCKSAEIDFAQLDADHDGRISREVPGAVSGLCGAVSGLQIHCESDLIFKYAGRLRGWLCGWLRG